MAYKKNGRKKKTNGRKYSASEKKSYKAGFFAGLFSAKKKKSGKKKSVTKKKQKHTRTLMQDIKYYRDHNLGVLYRDGKYYDTNFIDKPVEITKSEIAELHQEYSFGKKRRDIDVANDYVRHMRRKFGVFSKETGEFLHMLGEDKKK